MLKKLEVRLKQVVTYKVYIAIANDKTITIKDLYPS